MGSSISPRQAAPGCAHVPKALLSTLIIREDGLRITGRWKRPDGNRSSEIPARPPRVEAAALPQSSRRNAEREQSVTVLQLEMGILRFSLMNVCGLVLINAKVQMNRHLCSYGSGGERNPKTQLGASISQGRKSLSTLPGSEEVRAAEGLRLKGRVVQLVSSP